MKPKPGLKGFFMGKKTDNVTEEEIVSIVNEGHEMGIIESSEMEMINNIFELDDKEAKDIMTHRKNMTAIDGSLKLDDVALFMLDESHSRYPVYYEDIDNILGIIHFKDAMIYREKYHRGSEALKDIEGLIRKVPFIPETRKIQDIFKEMQQNKIHMEVVVDEYGQTSGIVTMEDILEEIVGNIFDEYDEVCHNIVKLEDGIYKILGITPLYELEEELGIDFKDADNETINGYLISKLDRVPEEGETPEIEDEFCHYKVTKVSDRMIKELKLTLNKPIEA